MGSDSITWAEDMTIAQITLTVEESKRLIAEGVKNHPYVNKVLKKGSILFKGGSTVCKVSEIITKQKLELCGIITCRGTVINMGMDYSMPHISLYENYKLKNIDSIFMETALKMTDKDLVICGANAIDNHGNAAMMVGNLSGGDTSYALNTWYGEGVPILIPVGYEKLVPNNINEIIKKTGRKKKSYSLGMSVGLVPLIGEIITEVEAISYISGLESYVIGSGGLGTAKGSLTLDVVGEKSLVKDFVEYIMSLKSDESDSNDDYTECEAICKFCIEHIGCIHKRKGKEVIK